MNKDAPGQRLFPLDALRGLIIVLMALDHANYFIAQQHASGEHWGGAFPAYSSALAFLTRLVTHLSAPGFFFLMGVGMTLFTASKRAQGWSTPKLIAHFWIRGAVLILLQFFVINSIWQAGPEYFPEIYIGVLVALGGTMMLGSLFLNLKPLPLLLLTFGLFLGTEALHPGPEMWQLTMDIPNQILLRSGGSGFFWSNYPVLPWLELVVFGILFGKWLRIDKHKAYQTGLHIGIALLIAFVFLRALDGFGNIRPRAGDAWIDWLNVVKYPPSMTFSLLTMGINLIVLWAFSRAGKLVETASRFLVTFGREPLFMYVAHLGLYLLIGKWFLPHGSSIPAMLPFWVLGLAILYPLARLYGRIKRSKHPLHKITTYL
ncbi:MAG: DUF1624 domain-containing protein [Anaerolineales bacterium]